MHVRLGIIAGITVGLFVPEIKGFLGGFKARKDLAPIITATDFQAAFIKARLEAMKDGDQS